MVQTTEFPQPFQQRRCQWQKRKQEWTRDAPSPCHQILTRCCVYFYNRKVFFRKVLEISRQRCALVDNITVKTYIDFDLLLCPRGSFTETQKNPKRDQHASKQQKQNKEIEQCKCLNGTTQVRISRVNLIFQDHSGKDTRQLLTLAIFYLRHFAWRSKELLHTLKFNYIPVS